MRGNPEGQRTQADFASTFARGDSRFLDERFLLSSGPDDLGIQWHPSDKDWEAFEDGLSKA